MFVLERRSPMRPRPLLSVGTGARLRCALVAALSFSIAGCGGAEPGEPGTSLVVVTLDTLRADHLGCYGYFRNTSPRIDALAAEGVLFEQVFAPMATTLPAHASLFTGLYPIEHGVLANTNQGGRPFAWRSGARTVAQLAREAGFVTGGFVSAAPLKRHSGIQVGFDAFDQPEGFERPATETVDAALAWLDEVAGERIFLWVHLYDPHARFEPPPEHDVFRTDAALEAWIAERGIPPSAKQRRGREPLVTRAALNGYDGEIRYADAEFGRLVDRLRASGVLARAVLVVTADHGEGLNQHDWPAHGHVWEEQVRVPWIVRLPQGRGTLPARFERLVSLVDVLPTVLPRVDAGLAARFAEQASGKNVLAPGFVERPVLSQRSERESWKDVGELFSLTTAEWRLHLRPGEGNLLFDRAGDPHELDDVGTERPEVVEALGLEIQHRIGELTEHASALGEADPDSAPAVDVGLVDELEELGYLGGDEE